MLGNWIDAYIDSHPWAHWVEIIFFSILGLIFLYTWYDEFSYDLKNGKSVKESFFNRGILYPLMFIATGFLAYVIEWVFTAVWDLMVKIF